MCIARASCGLVLGSPNRLAYILRTDATNVRQLALANLYSSGQLTRNLADRFLPWYSPAIFLASSQSIRIRRVASSLAICSPFTSIGISLIRYLAGINFHFV